MTSGSQDLHALYRRFLVAVMLVVVGTGPPFPRAGLAADTSKPRLAIVISNGDYSELGPLRNPVADGQLVASALRNTGFNVTYLKNLKDEQFRATLRQIARDSAKADVTLVYYAGHGAQVAGVNYLLPVDISRPEQEDDIRLASVSADEVLSVIKSPYKILILDACRDNPIVGRALSRGRSASYKSGLAPVSPPAEATGGVFIAYSTQTNAIAIDGDGANSPFAEAFAAHVGNRTSIDDMFALVTKDVLKKTNGFQRPFKYASLDTVFCLTVECSSGLQAITSGAALQTAVGVAGSVQEKFAALAAEKSPVVRKQMEDQLWQQLRDTLPKRILYGDGTSADGKPIGYGFLPATVVTDTHHATVMIKEAQWKEGKISYDEDASAEESVDCDTHTMMRTRVEAKGSVKLFTQAERKADTVTNAVGSIGASLERLLCTAPVRITPLWAMNELSWLPLGQAGDKGARFEGAPTITYQDPDNSDIKYLLVHGILKDVPGTKLDETYGWMGIDCKTKEFFDAGSFGIAQRAVVAVIANRASAQTYQPVSPAANGYVLLCDQPQGSK
jgi:caspase domain-containing protein